MLDNIKRILLLNRFKSKLCANCKREILVLSKMDRPHWLKSEEKLCETCGELWEEVKRKCQ